MKKVLFVLVTVVLLGGFLFTGCSKKEKSSAGSDKITIGVLFDFLSVESRVKQRDSLIEFAKQYDVNLIFQSANGDERLQLQQAENLITQGVDVMVILAQNPEACLPIVLGCKEAGIPLLVTDRPLENMDVGFFVGINMDDIGYMQVDYALARKPEGKWVMLAGAPTDPLARIWRDSWVDRLQPYIARNALQIVADERCDNWDPNVALKHMENILTANRDDIDVVLVMNDGLATGVIQALEARGLAGKVLMTGLDGEIVAYQRIVEGKQAMTVAFDDVAIADAIVKSAISAAKKEQLATNGTIDNGDKRIPAFLIDPFVVDINNLEQVVIKGGLATREEIYQ